MRIELSTFFGIILSSWIIAGFFLEYFNSRQFSKIRKVINLKRGNCEFCRAVYFVPFFSGFWRCPRCESINKEK